MAFLYWKSLFLLSRDQFREPVNRTLTIFWTWKIKRTNYLRMYYKCIQCRIKSIIWILRLHCECVWGIITNIFKVNKLQVLTIAKSQRTLLLIVNSKISSYFVCVKFVFLFTFSGDGSNIWTKFGWKRAFDRRKTNL